MGKYVNVEKLIEKILENKGGVPEELVTQIIGTVVRTAMENCETPEKITQHESGVYQFDHITRESFSAEDLARHDFKLKEVMYVPYCNKQIAFRVEHVTDEKAYLVAINCIGRTKIKNIDKCLDNFIKELPEDLLDICGEIEHRVNSQLIRKSKVTLLSYGNTAGCKNCNGVDDIQFDGLRAEKSINEGDEEICWYWEDTPYDYENDGYYASDSTQYRYVYFYGRPGHNYNSDSDSNGIHPCLCILRNRV